MTLATLPKNPLTLKEFSLHDLFLRQSLDSTFNKLATGYKPPKLQGRPHAVKEFILLHTEKELVLLYRHAGRLIEKVFTDVDGCLDFAQNRFGVTL
jgi:hypothetical protein